ncbi:MAG: hypothetical protein MJ070_03015 [Lachnospiraceae bacterium]|nr:hypothetical protein [Lachnospiraceae bacterium]
MKLTRTIAALLLAASLLSFSSCGEKPAAPEVTEPETENVTENVTEEDITVKDPKNTPEGFNYVISTQAFNPNYQFTKEPPLMEIGGRIMEMGANAIKFYATSDTMVDKLLKKYDYRYVIMWYRSDPYFKDGVYSDEERKNDYNAFYNYTKKLLTKYNGSGIEFFLGHWEGDWYFVDNYNTAQKTVSADITDAMIEWINNRQQAVDDAKRDVAHENVWVWNYIEINRPTDAMDDKMDRVMNRVLPFTNVDYVSYSAYDSMAMAPSAVKKIIDKIYSYLPEKEGIIGPRVFIGEFGQPAANEGFDDRKHCQTNLKYFAKYLNCDVRFVLYWQMYDNEKLEDGRNRGFWLVNGDNEETELYHALEDVLARAKQYVTDYYEQNGTVPTHEAYMEFLREQPEFK